MVRSSQPTKAEFSFSEAFERRFQAYALAASAAGVSVLACAVPAGAEVISRELFVSLRGNSSYAFNPTGTQMDVFNIVASFLSLSTDLFWNRVWFRDQSAGAFALLGASSLPADLPAGAVIGPGGNFGKGASYGLLFSYGPYGGGTRDHHKGNFQIGQVNYLGFKFSIAGREHFGWARMIVQVAPGPHHTKQTVTELVGYGYEAVPGKAIHAGQTGPAQAQSNGDQLSEAPDLGSLGGLALGTGGLSLWRRKNSGLATPRP